MKYERATQENFMPIPLHKLLKDPDQVQNKMKYAILSPRAHMPSYATFLNRTQGQKFKCNSYLSKMMVNLEQRLWTSINPFWKRFNSKVSNFIG